MKKKLSALSLLWIAFTSMIGSGWLFGSLYSAHFAGPAAVLAWPLAAFLLLFVALAYAEVATMFPQADNLAALPLYTHGRLTSIVMSGLAWLSLATIPVIETQGLVQYASNYFPSLMNYEGLHYTATFVGSILAVILLFSFVCLNYFGLALFSKINSGFTVWKLLIPSMTIFALLSVSYHLENFNQFGGFMPYGWQGVMAAMSSGGVLFSLLGFRQVVIMMSEVENPGKYVPLVLISSLLLTALLYTGLQWSFIVSLRSQDLLNGWAHLSFVGDAGPFAALAGFAGLIWLSLLLYSDAFISPYSTGLVYSTTAARLLSSMGQMQEVPQALVKVNQYQSPWLSLLVNFILALFMFNLLKNWQAMASFLVAVMMVSYALGPISLICLRKQLPTYPRPYRVYGATLIAFVGFYVCTAGVYWSGFYAILKLLVLTLLGLVFLFLYSFVASKQRVLDVRNGLWFFLYLLGLGLFSYFGNYGGTKFISLYWDLLYLAIFSFFIFMLALISRKDAVYTEKCVRMRTDRGGSGTSF